MKRIISVFMVLCLIVAMAPAVFATVEVEPDTSWYESGNYT